MKEEQLQITHKETVGRVRILKAVLYNSHMIYIRMIGKDYFEYLTEYNGEIYSGYIIITPSGKKKKLTEDEIQQCSALVYAGAEATLDTLLGIKVDDETEKSIELFEKNRDKVEGKGDKDAVVKTLRGNYSKRK
jgi:hypothetical protein